MSSLRFHIVGRVGNYSPQTKPINISCPESKKPKTLAKTTKGTSDYSSRSAERRRRKDLSSWAEASMAAKNKPETNNPRKRKFGKTEPNNPTSKKPKLAGSKPSKVSQSKDFNKPFNPDKQKQKPFRLKFQKPDGNKEKNQPLTKRERRLYAKVFIFSYFCNFFFILVFHFSHALVFWFNCRN